MRLTGPCIKIEHQEGKFTPTGSADEVPFDNYLFHILDDDAVVVLKVKVGRGTLPPWKKGEVVNVNVSLPAAWKIPYSHELEQVEAPQHVKG